MKCKCFLRTPDCTRVAEIEYIFGKDAERPWKEMVCKPCADRLEAVLAKTKRKAAAA